MSGPIGIGSQIEGMDEMDLNSFSLKPDALIYFAIAQLVGITAKGIDQNKSTTDIFMMKAELVDDLETLCESQGYLYEDGKKQKDGTMLLDPYYAKVEAKKQELKLDATTDDNSFWRQKYILSKLKFKEICKRVFGGASKPKDWVY